MVRRAARARRGVEDRQVECELGSVGGLVVEVGGEVEQQVVALLDDLGDAGVGTVGLVDHAGSPAATAASALRSTKRVCGSGPSEASTSSTTPSTIDRPRSTSPPKSAWPGVSMTLMTIIVPSGVMPVHGGVLREDGDALLALEVAGVHDPVDQFGAFGEGARLPQHGIDQRGLAVVDVRNDRDVAEIGGSSH